MSLDGRPAASPTLIEILADPSRGLDLERDQAAAMLAQVGALREILRARLATMTVGNGGSIRRPSGTSELPKARGRFLTLDEMVQRSRKSRGWFHAHWRRTFPSAVKKGRTVLVPEADFERWLCRP